MIFNTLSLIVLSTSIALRQTASGMYLIALSAADMMYLFGEFLRWLNKGHRAFGIDVHFMDVGQFACKSIYFLRYAGIVTSAWLTVAITTERLLLVSCPIKHARISTPLRTRLSIGVIYIVGCLAASFTWWSVGSVRFKCVIVHSVWYDVSSWVSLRIGSLLLPGIVVCVMTSAIIYFMTQAQRKRNRLSYRHTLQRQQTIVARKLTLEKQLTAMLIAVAVAFVVLRLPYTITYYLYSYRKYIWYDQSDALVDQIKTADLIADTIATLNYVVNFFLYYVCGDLFRRQLRIVCTCAVCDPRAIISRQRSASSMPMTTGNHNASSR